MIMIIYNIKSHLWNGFWSEVFGLLPRLQLLWKNPVNWLQVQWEFSSASSEYRGVLCFLLHWAFIPTKHLGKTRGSIFTSSGIWLQRRRFWLLKRIWPPAPRTYHRRSNTPAPPLPSASKSTFPKGGFTQGCWWDFHPFVLFFHNSKNRLIHWSHETRVKRPNMTHACFCGCRMTEEGKGGLEPTCTFCNRVSPSESPAAWWAVSLRVSERVEGETADLLRGLLMQADRSEHSQWAVCFLLLHKQDLTRGSTDIQRGFIHNRNSPWELAKVLKFFLLPPDPMYIKCSNILILHCRVIFLDSTFYYKYNKCALH